MKPPPFGYVRCPLCKGKGITVHLKMPCPHCEGAGYVDPKRKEGK